MSMNSQPGFGTSSNRFPQNSQPLGLWQQVGSGPQVPRSPACPPAPVPVRTTAHRSATGVGNAVLLLVAALVLAGVGVLLTMMLGTSALILCGILALVPLTICILGIRWIDRWDPEPRGALTFAFFWGAGMSVAVTLLLGPTVTELLSAGFSGAGSDVVGPVLQAPLLEEVAKGLGVLILALSHRSHFDGPVDGIVYAGTVAAGFAFTENILYFGAALTDPAGIAGLVTVFVTRGLFSPFAHVMFTAALGLVIGLAVARRRSAGRLGGAFVLGLIPAIAGHMLWNGGLVVLFSDFFSFYFLVQVPLFLAVLLGVIALRRAERKVTSQRLAEYAGAGWLTEQEVGMVASPAGRTAAMAWARSVGAADAMKRFIRTGTRLAFVRQRLRAGHGSTSDGHLELQLLENLNSARGRMIAAASARRMW
ncbi:PrsW family intramembrane metalloprotease [Arthrobacter sp. JZ12]|uniref:PrsW family intramembrane metalloprotease n=1 Tax=Arthrobacter sp. JZ12 TaxID=2654190 RepID=UPI002B4A3CF9|nr:PrsW family intramembrane metalloprotease [Arthrobacter sp. JZ12]WRH25030.1 PrsW family intramembrane metalloprotease [Arthrobacter sp. JZ12]